MDQLDKLVAQMTLEEKAGLCSGADFWRTKGVPRLGIPSVMMADGPHGLRKRTEIDALGMHKSVPATCFPTASALACTWDTGLIQKIGEALGEECRAQNVSILLGPGCNIKRSPLCGRNFEYFSEDPYLSSELAAAYINGVQSKGVGCSLKHFAANNQETRRMNIDARLDERTLREIYLCAFEGAVKKAAPKTVMCAYNRVNGEYCSQNKYLLSDILKNEWGFEGCVVSDWGAVADRVRGLAAGLDIEMPCSGGERDQKVLEAVLNGDLPESVLDEAARRILKIVFDTAAAEQRYVADLKAHHRLAKAAAMESIVLLKNESILPLKKQGTIAVLGGFAKQPRYQGAGSSHVNPAFLETAYDEILKMAEADGFHVEYAQGYRLDGEAGSIIRQELTSAGDEADEALLCEAVLAARNADAAILFVGLPENYETEGVDRIHLRIPAGHGALIERVAAAQKNMVVVLSNGAPVEMPWLSCTGAVLEGYLTGQGSGGAVAAILFGDANPCGKLAETFPANLSDTPAFLNFPGERDRVEYREGLFVGYRYYDAKELPPLFPFGYGLSYTEFAYSGLKLDQGEMNDTDELKVCVTVKNTGKIPGKEIVQLYVRPPKTDVIRPEKELKGFGKVSLKPGEKKEVTFVLGPRSFSHFDPSIGGWRVQDGRYEILIGKSSREIVLNQCVQVHAKKRTVLFTEDSTLGDILEYSDRVEKIDAILEQVNFMGVKRISDLPVIFREMPLRSVLGFTPGGLHYAQLEYILEILNGQG